MVAEIVADNAHIDRLTKTGTGGCEGPWNYRREFCGSLAEDRLGSRWLTLLVALFKRTTEVLLAAVPWLPVDAHRCLRLHKLKSLRNRENASKRNDHTCSSTPTQRDISTSTIQQYGNLPRRLFAVQLSVSPLARAQRSKGTVAAA
jgi:hypothetical protein